MRIILTLAACAALAACGQATAPVEEAEATSPGDTAAGDVSGSYQVTMADGTVMIETIAADGTYLDTTSEGVETERGRWRQDGSKMCFDPDGDPPEACFVGGAPGVDGSFTVEDADGKVSMTIKRIEPDTTGPAEAGAAPAQ